MRFSAIYPRVCPHFHDRVLVYSQSFPQNPILAHGDRCFVTILLWETFSKTLDVRCILSKDIPNRFYSIRTLFFFKKKISIRTLVRKSVEHGSESQSKYWENPTSIGKFVFDDPLSNSSPSF